MMNSCISMHCGQEKEIKKRKGGHIGKLYHKLSFNLIELMFKAPLAVYV